MPSEADPRSVGERIERLLDASAAAGPLVRERSEELVRLVAELYASGLERFMDLIYDSGLLSDEIVERIANDEVLSALLLVHDLHPYDVGTRVVRAIESLRVSTGTDIEIAEAGDGRIRLRVSGGGCGTADVKTAIRDALTAAVPELDDIQIDAQQAVIALESLAVRLRPEPNPVAGQ